MKSKHDAFHKKYFAAKSQEQQLEMLKEYMLSLSADELRDFLMEDLREIKKALLAGKIDPAGMKALDKGLAECEALARQIKQKLAVRYEHADAAAQ